MGSSARKKREKKKDFQKTKLKVGKTKPKAANHTDTSFRAKAIVLNQQSLTSIAPSTEARFSHHVSLLTSKTDSQRRDSLSFLTTFVSSQPVDNPLPQPVSFLLPKLCPLILDGSSGVRTQLLRLLRALPEDDMRDHVPEVLPYVRAGMTHLAADIRLSTMDVLSWLLEVSGDELVACAGGFVKTMNCFLSALNWNTSSMGVGQVKFGKAGTDGKPMAKVLQVLGQFLDAGIGSANGKRGSSDKDNLKRQTPMWHTKQHLLPSRSNAYGYLNLFGAVQNDENGPIEDQEDRINIFNTQFRGIVEAGVDVSRKEGGEIGRSAKCLVKVMKEAKAAAED